MMDDENMSRMTMKTTTSTTTFKNNSSSYSDDDVDKDVGDDNDNTSNVL